MKKILGLDIATKTGWSLLEVDDNNVVTLKEFGTIQIPSSFSTPQRLNYLNVELNRLVERLKPNYAAIEDIIMGLSGVKVLVYLARLNGVVIQTLFDKLKDNAKLYTPPEWKKNCFEGLSGSAEKCQIQIAVCKYFKLSTEDKLSYWSKTISDFDLKLNEARTKNKLLTTEIKKLKSKKNSDVELLNQKTKELEETKKFIKNFKKLNDKEMAKISDDICAHTGITNDVADSVGIAYCLSKKI